MRNRVQDPAVAAPSGGSIDEGSNENREALVKVALIGLVTVGLMLYESQVASDLNAKAAALQSQVAQLEVEAQAKAQEVEGIKDIASQAKELEDKLKIIRELSRLRLREVKTLDFMQSSIPEKVWLKSLALENEGASGRRARLKFIGNAVTTDDLSDFVKKLEDSAYLSEVIVTKNQETQGVGGRNMAVREFEFSAEVEGAE